MNTRAIHWVGRALVAFDAAIMGFVVVRLLRVPENHWGVDNRLLIPFFAVQWVLAIWLLRSRPAPVLRVLTAVAMVGLIASVSLIQLNLLLPYELWLRRGMPACGSW